MNRKKDIINTIRSISGKYSEYEVFNDWIRCCALAISNSLDIFHGKVWQDRERTYLDTIKKYTAKEAEEFPRMCAMLAESFEDHMSDILGEIYMEAGMGSKAAGQRRLYHWKNTSWSNIPTCNRRKKIWSGESNGSMHRSRK